MFDYKDWPWKAKQAFHFKQSVVLLKQQKNPSYFIEIEMLHTK